MYKKLNMERRLINSMLVMKNKKKYMKHLFLFERFVIEKEYDKQNIGECK
jgi:hypothetical protein